MKQILQHWLILAFLLTVPTPLIAQDDDNDDEPASFADLIADLDHKAGLFDIYVDVEGGRVLGLLPKADAKGHSLSVIYTEYLRAGLGSNPVGLDRSQQGVNYVLAFKRMGSNVYAEVENTNYRALTDNQLERDSVRQSFAASVIWSGEIEGEDDDGNILVDLSSFLLRDVHDIAQTLDDSDQGNFSLSKDLSFVDTSATWAFPENVELESLLTFTSKDPGAEVRQTTPEPRNVSLQMHHSFIKLPDAGYQPREYDARTAAIRIDFQDYAAGLDENFKRSYAIRHRLQKTDPNAPISEVIEPIVYYVDSGAPKEIKEALIEGGNWWATAFEKAGFRNAYRVEELPEGAHPLDARYNIINWVHRQTRGWSYGGAVIDPRTGEIIKGVVLLGSLRVRQDRMIFEGLIGADGTGSGTPDDPVQIALARIRQLSAHEIGHTLGFEHNMAASTVFNRSSVMDYPAPQVSLRADGSIDLSDAYGVGMGAWDDFTVKWLYSQFPEGTDEKEALNAMTDEAYASGLRFVEDRHSRPIGTANAYGALWDTGEDPIASLNNQMAVRAVALKNFGEHNVAAGEPLSQLRNVIVPIYLFHRFQVQAAAKSIGGLYFSYPERGDDQARMQIVQPDRQWAAVNAVLATLAPSALDLSDATLSVLNPGDFGYGPAATREMFGSRTGDAFDLMGAADVAIDMSLRELLHEDRVSRIVEFNRRDSANPSFEAILSHMDEFIFDRPRGESGREGEIRMHIQAAFVNHLIGLGGNVDLGYGVTMRVEAYLSALRDRLQSSRERGNVLRAHRANLARIIAAHLDRPSEGVSELNAAPSTPPGSPIGSSDMVWLDEDICWSCALIDN